MVMRSQFGSSFWGGVVDDSSCVHDGTIFWDASDFIMCEIENFIGANRDTFFPLGKAM
jgi:hypothetical protein